MSPRAPALKPIHPDLIPPQGSTPVGVTPNGKQLYKRTIVRAKIVDKVNPETGEKEYRKNTITGEQLHPLREVARDARGRPIREKREQLFYLQSEGNGNLRIVEYHPPSEEDLREAVRKQRVEHMKDALAETLVDLDLSPAELVARLRGGEGNLTTEPAPDAPEGQVPGRETDFDFDIAPPETVEPAETEPHPVWGVGTRDLPEALGQIEDARLLGEYLAAEKLNPEHEGGRTTAIAAITARLGEVEGGELVLEEAEAREEARDAQEGTPEL